jgi:hypothetical protein
MSENQTDGSGSETLPVAPGLKVREFVRREILGNDKITDEEIQKNWQATGSTTPLNIATIKRERTLFNKLLQYDQDSGLVDFFSSQASLLLAQYRNIEQLLGPPGSDWTWPGEHCETLLREAIQRQLPPSLLVGKGYIDGVRKTENGVERSPEIDILVYNREMFAPLFSMDHFVIVRPESVVAAVQVKRTLDANTLAKAVQNVVAAKHHVSETCQFNGSVTTQNMFSAVVSFEEGVQAPGQANLSESYATAIKPHISEFHHGYFLPDFIGFALSVKTSLSTEVIRKSG